MTARKFVAIARALAAPVLYILVLKIAGLAIRSPVGSSDAFVELCAGIVVATICVALLAKSTRLSVRVRATSFSGASWVVVLTFGCVCAAGIALDGGVHPSTTTVARIVIFCALIGVGEELTFRGVCLTSLTEVMGKGNALVCSSVLFGLSHFSNLWAGQSIATTRLQVVWAMLGGLFFGWLYLKMEGGLWVVAIAHAVYDGALLCIAVSQASIVVVLFAGLPFAFALLMKYWFGELARQIR